MGVGAVLFDLDGTLIDSAEPWRAALAALVARRLPNATSDVFDGLTGTTALEAVKRIRERLQWVDGDLLDDVCSVEDHVRSCYAREVVWTLGAQALVGTVRAAGIATGLVTSTSRRVVDTLLGTVNCPAFDVVISGDDVLCAKPHPEPYLRAAGQLHLDPADCVVVEDSALGVSSARAAGCPVIVIGGSGSCIDTMGCVSVSDLTEVSIDLVADLMGSVKAVSGI